MGTHLFPRLKDERSCTRLLRMNESIIIELEQKQTKIEKYKSCIVLPTFTMASLLVTPSSTGNTFPSGCDGTSSSN